MSVVALILFVIAAVVFLLVPDPIPPARRPNSVALGLFVLTLALIAQFLIDNRPIHL